MKISILTLFPEMFSIFDHSIIGRARENKIVDYSQYEKEIDFLKMKGGK